MAKRRDGRHVCCTSKFWLVLTILLLTLLYSGVIYGWTGMLLILRREGVYSEYSPGEQQEKFDFIMTVASFFTAGSGIIIGLFLDKFGPRLTAALSGAVTIGGCFVFGLQLQLIVGYAMFAVGGMGILISSFRAGYLFPEHQSLVIGSISCLFDSSSVVFVVFDLLYTNLGVSLKWLCFGYAGITLVVHIIAYILWLMNPEYDNLPAEQPDDGQTEPLLPDAIQVKEMELVVRDKSEGELVADLPFKKQLCTPEFVFVYFFCCIMMFRSNMFLGTAGNFLLSLGDAQHNDLYATFLASIIPLGFIFVPLISYFLDSRGFAVSGYCVVFIGLVYGGLSIVPILQLQLGTAFAFTFFRAALFSFVAAFNAKIFGPQSVGRVTGILYTSTAVLITLQYPLTALTVHVFNGNYQPMHIGLTVLCGLTLPLVLYVQLKSKEVGTPVPLDDESSSVDEPNAKPGSGRLSRSGSQIGVPRSWSLTSEKEFQDAMHGSHRSHDRSDRYDRQEMTPAV